MSEVGRALVEWFASGHRDLPWRGVTDPYRIWVSEIMLQQTRSETVIPYYHRFLERFPTPEALAAASGQEVLAMWSGLGYYSRARNLHEAARQVAARGEFPADYDSLRALPGIGDYTAAAIASIAFGLPHPVVDGNVLRVVARVENDAADIGSARTRERFRGIAGEWLDRRRPGEFNQALMELGATVCLPRNPRCLLCPLQRLCRAREAGTAGELPVKLRRTKPERLELTTLIVRRGERLLLPQRPADSRRLAGFWELPGPADLPEAVAGEVLAHTRHTITHHHYTVTARSAQLPAKWKIRMPFRWFRAAELSGIPLTTISRKCLAAMPRISR